jgi:putative spermidine/putrescine transport system ATP-binding protein
MCDRIAVMRAGRLEQMDTPHAVYEHPLTPFVADFVGRTNRLEGMRDGAGAILVGELRLRAEAAGPAGPVVLMIRPHRILLGETGGSPHDEGGGWNRCDGVVRRVTYVGDVLACEMEAGGATISVERHTQPGLAAPKPGEAMALAWRVSDTLAFPAAAA